jgi:TorA maturation chaperone TorD
MTGTAPETIRLAEAWSRPDPVEAPARATEFERLFVGPGPVPCPPYESYWREDVPFLLRGTLMGPCTAGLVDLYAQLGLQLAPDAHELPDHVAVELEAMAVAESDPAGRDVAHALLEGHLAVWLPRFCGAVQAETVDEFYRCLAATTRRWLDVARGARVGAG